MATRAATGRKNADWKAMVSEAIHRLPSTEQLVLWFILSAGGILVFTGAANLLGFFGSSSLLETMDPILGIRFRFVVLFFGLAELILAFLCLYTGKRGLTLGLLAWLAANLIVYRVGLSYMGWPRPPTCLGNLVDLLNVSPRAADTMMSAVAAYLLVGSCLLLWKSRRVAPKALKLSCPNCGGHIRFSAQNLGQQIPCPHCRTTITLRKPDEMLKMSCFFCKEHIEFPSHALGQKIKCPHCKMDITLRIA